MTFCGEFAAFSFTSLIIGLRWLRHHTFGRTGQLFGSDCDIDACYDDLSDSKLFTNFVHENQSPKYLNYSKLLVSFYPYTTDFEQVCVHLRNFHRIIV